MSRRESHLKLVNASQPESSAPSPSIARLQDLEPQYEILREIGRGGTAIVYQARERELDRDVAIKVVRPSHVDDGDAVARLAREARLVALLRHPNIVPLFGTRHLGDGSLALIMQYVPGRTLKAAIREGPLPTELAVGIIRDVAYALQYAHARHGVVHRDIKPENIYLDSDLGRALLADFGIARSLDSESSLTLAGSALGTPAYMSPEQIDGESLDARSDLYSLGLVAWEMLTGQQPWAGHNLYTIIYKQKHEDLPPLREFRSDVPDGLGRAIEGALRKSRDQRWSDAAQFVAIIDGAPPPAVMAAPAMTPRAVPQVVAADDALTIMYRREDALRAEPAAVAAVDAGAAFPEARTVAQARPAERPARPWAWLAGVAVALLVIFVAWSNSSFFIEAMGGTGQRRNSDPDRGARVAAPAPAAVPGTASGAARLVAVEDRVGVVGEPLSGPVVVLVEDSAGRAVTGASILFTVADGGGSVAPAVVVSDSLGLASAFWTLGTRAGRHELTAATTDDSGVFVVVTGVAVAGDPARLVNVPLDDQPGSAQVVAARVEDGNGNPVSGAPVEFRVTAGGGAVDPVATTSDTMGVARTTWTLGDGSETNTLRAGIPRTGIELVRSAAAAFRLRTQSQLVVGGTHTCVLSGADGEALCWGGNDAGQLGGGLGRRTQGAVNVGSGLRLARLASGMAHSCALDRGGAAYCWGMNDSGQLGTGDRAGQNAPAPVRGVASFSAITAGLAHTCALSENGRAYCWGAGSSGQLGDGRGSDRTAPVAVAGSTTFSALAAGWRHTCGLAAGSVYCWGMNGDGQLGDGSTADRAAPTPVAAREHFVAVAAGAEHSCALTGDGDAYCWGQNERGQLGTATNARIPQPAKVETGVRLASIVAGAVHSCGLARSGEAYCWGGNNFGQLGSGDTRDSSVPVPVAGGHRFASLSAGGSHTCGRVVSGEQYCWGYNVDGQLGDGTRNERSRPARVTVARP